MKQRSGAIGGVFAIVALVATAFIYNAIPVHASDHQDTLPLASRANTSVDITDVYAFIPADNATNTNCPCAVFAIATSPLVAAGTGTAHFFDPQALYQIKISHQASGVEDEVIQVNPTGTGPSQTFTVYVGAPNEVGTTNTLLATSVGTAPYNKATTFSDGIQFFAGPRADEFQFDLFAFFSFLGDRFFATHTSATDPGAGDNFFNGDTTPPGNTLSPAFDQTAARATMPSFNGFAAGTMSSAGAGAYACSTNPAENALTDIGGGFNTENLVIEVPIKLLNAAFTGTKIGVWATASTQTGS
jgi:hypothetical protein